MGRRSHAGWSAHPEVAPGNLTYSKSHCWEILASPQECHSKWPSLSRLPVLLGIRPQAYTAFSRLFLPKTGVQSPELNPTVIKVTTGK